MNHSDFSTFQRLSKLSLDAATELDFFRRRSLVEQTGLPGELSDLILSFAQENGEHSTASSIDEVNELYRHVWANQSGEFVPTTVSELRLAIESRMAEFVASTKSLASVPSAINICVAIHECCVGRIQQFMDSEMVEGYQ
jgi:hypothetical protein